MRFTSKIFVVCLAVLTSFVAVAQTPATGLYAFGSFDNRGFDTINRGNLNIHFTIPIINKQGRGGSNFYYALSYDGLVWSPTSSSGTAVWTPNSNWGWSTIDQAEFGNLTNAVLTGSCLYGPQHIRVSYFTYYDYVYYDRSGRTHPIAGITLVPPNECNVPPNNSGTGGATDGSGYTASVSLSPPSRMVYTKGGAAYSPGSTSGTYTDTNGNQISASSSGAFTDTTGKTVLTATGSGTPSSPVVYQYTDSNGNPQTVTVNYSQNDVLTRFGCSGITEYGPVLLNLISSIVLADGSTYSFTYEQTPGYAGHVTGRVASVTLPTGGTISYSYSGGCSGGIEPDGTNATLNRTTADSATPATYTRSAVTSTSSTTTYVDPVGNTGVYTFLENTGGFFYENGHSLYTGGVSGTPIEQVTTCYNQTYPCSSPNVNSTFATIAVNTVHDGITIGTDTKTYTGPELLSQDAGPTGITTTNTYQTFTGPYSIPFYRIASTSNGQSSVTYKYDEGTPNPTSGLPQHVAITTARGNLTSIHPNGYTQNITYDDAGQVLTESDYNNNVTTFAYDSTTDTFPQSVTYPTINGIALSTSSVYDIQSGLMTSSTDVNGNLTTYSYYGSLRPKEIDNPDGGKTNYYYPNPNQVSMVTAQNGLQAKIPRLSTMATGA